MDDNKTEAGGIVPTVWGEALPFCPEIVTLRHFAATGGGEELSVLLDTLRVDLEAGKLLSDAAVLTFRAPVTSPPEGKRLKGYTTTIRGAIDKSGGSHAIAVINMGGGIRVIEFGKEGDNRSDLFTEDISIPVEVAEAIPVVFSGSVLLSAERPSLSEFVLFEINTLDISAEYA